MPKLVYFTDRYPFLEDWHPNDLAVLARSFEEILVAPLHGYEGTSKPLPSNVVVASPLFTSCYLQFSWSKAI